jgi:DNA-binding CsgD family transcriptional regulator
MRGLTRQEKENLVLELYSQGKTYHEIAKEARVSLRDIGPILKKSGIEQSLSLSSQAYKLFSENKSPSEVAIALNIREPEVTQLYREYWRLNQLYELNHTYEETKGNFSYLLELYREVRAAGMTVAHAIRLLRIANKDLPSIEHTISFTL